MESCVSKKVYKFGYTKNVKDRMAKHVNKYGGESVIDTLIFLPVDYLSTAETKLKNTLGKKYAYVDGNETELLLLSDDERTTVRNAMRTVGETFFGQTVVHLHQLDMLKKAHDHNLDMFRKDAEIALKNAEIALSKKDQELIVAKKDAELAKKDAELAKKDAEMAKKDNVILEMKN